MDRSGDHALAAGAFCAGIADRSQPLMHDGSAAVARLRDRLHAVAELAQFIECPSCFFRVRFSCHKKLLDCSKPTLLPDIPQEILANFMPGFFGRMLGPDTEGYPVSTFIMIFRTSGLGRICRLF